MTYTWLASRLSRPEIWIRHGLIFARPRPSRRNQRPVRSLIGSRSNSLTIASSGVHARMSVALAVQIQIDRSRRNIRWPHQNSARPHSETMRTWSREAYALPVRDSRSIVPPSGAAGAFLLYQLPGAGLSRPAAAAVRVHI